MFDDQTALDQIKDYYGSVLSSNQDLQTSACCCSENFPPAQRAALELELEDICEDYGQTATYLGTIAGNPHTFALDDHHLFVTGKPMLVCGNTAAMVQQTRFSPHFRVTGDTSVHYGPFDCSPAAGSPESAMRGGGCC